MVHKRSTLLVLALVAEGCSFDSPYGGTRYQCGQPEQCPPGFTCQGGVCRDDEPGNDDGGPSGPLVGGDILFLTFDDPSGLGLVRDRSGNRHDAHPGGGAIMPGQFGNGLLLDDDDSPYLADSPAFFPGNSITIEAWINRDQQGVERGIFGDRVGQAAEYSFEIGADDRLLFRTNDNCVPNELVTVSSSVVVPVGVWTHVAISWDGAVARFLVDGEKAGEEPFDAMPCQLEQTHRLGRIQGTAAGTSLQGLIDEVKVSSAAKTQADIQASMAYDSTELVGECGDGIIETEPCERNGVCCTAACEEESEGSPCGAGTCSDGSCDLAGGRTTDGLVALYTFDEGSGTAIGDSSGGLPVDLFISTPSAVSWTSDGLDILSAPTIQNTAPSKIWMACMASGEVTVEVWITPASNTAYGQIVSMSDFSGDLDFNLQQVGPNFLGRVRSTDSSNRGIPAVDADKAAANLTHLVFTRAASGERSMYVDGSLRGQNVVLGDLPWNDQPLSIGDEAGANDPWLGTFHLMAIYDRALSPMDVARHFTAGP